MMTVDDALKLAEDVQNHGEKRSNSLSGQALAALAAEVRRLRQQLVDYHEFDKPAIPYSVAGTNLE